MPHFASFDVACFHFSSFLVSLVVLCFFWFKIPLVFWVFFLFAGVHRILLFLFFFVVVLFFYYKRFLCFLVFGIRGFFVFFCFVFLLSGVFLGSSEKSIGLLKNLCLLIAFYVCFFFLFLFFFTGFRIRTSNGSPSSKRNFKGSRFNQTLRHRMGLKAECVWKLFINVNVITRFLHTQKWGFTLICS